MLTIYLFYIECQSVLVMPYMLVQDALRQLWRLAFPDTTIPPLQSEAWKEMGWQGNDPSTDFRYNCTTSMRAILISISCSFQLILCEFISCRGGGFISLENLIYFAQNYPVINFLHI
jgi:ELMO domain-containing protein